MHIVGKSLTKSVDTVKIYIHHHPYPHHNTDNKHGEQVTEHADTVALGYSGSCKSQTLSQEQQVILVNSTIIVITIRV